jgi:hypothetical protein
MAILLPLAIQHEELLSALLADVHYWGEIQRAGQKSTSAQPESPPRPSQIVLYYRGRALARVRDKIEHLMRSNKSTPDDALMTAIAFIMRIDVSTSPLTSVFGLSCLTSTGLCRRTRSFQCSRTSAEANAGYKGRLKGFRNQSGTQTYTDDVRDRHSGTPCTKANFGSQ